MKLIVFLLLSGMIFAQNTYQTRTDANVKSLTTGLFWADSLYNGLYVTTDTTWNWADTSVTEIDTLSAKTSVELRLNFLYEFMNITAIDTGTTYTDSCIIEYAVYGLENNKVIDTTWQPVQFMRDSSWTNTNLIPDNNSVKSYQVYVGDYDLIRARMTNVTTVANRIWKFRATLSRKK